MADVFQTLKQRNRLQGGGVDALNAPFEPRVPNIGGATDYPPEKPIFKTPQIKPPTPQPEEDGELADIKRYLDLYKPDNRATDMFIDLMEHVPQRNKPSNWRRAGAGLAALGKGGMEVGDKILYEPYYTQMADFKNKADLLKDLAGAERAGNVNERLMLSSLLRQDVAERAQDTREKAQVEREKAGEAKREMDRIRTRLAQIREDKTLSDQQKAALNSKYAQDLERLRQEGRLGLAGEQADLDQELERLRQEGRVELEGVEQAGRIELKDIEGEKGELPTQTKVRQYNVAREIYNTDPDAKRFMKLGAPGTNDFQIIPRNAFLAGLRPEAQAALMKKYDEIVARIYGPGGAPSNPPARPRAATPTKPTAKPGRKSAADVLPPSRGGTLKRKVRSNTGKEYQVTSNDGGKTWQLPDGRTIE